MNEIIDNFKTVLFSNFANFEGRARRSEFWLFHLVLQLLSMVLLLPMIGMIFIVSLSAAKDSVGVAFILLLIVCVAILCVFLALLIPSLAITARRLHDTNRSGWWMCLAFVPFGNLAVLYFLVLDSDENANDYGEDPKEEERRYYRGLADLQKTATATEEQEGYVQNY